jgi:hypothetical protein
MTNILPLLILLAAQVFEQPGERFTHFAGFDLGEATFADVKNRYGESRIRERGQDADHETWICYSTDGAEIQFNSGEMGGEKYLLGFTISATPAEKDCPKPKATLPQGISGIELGISREQFAALVNHSIEWDKNVGTAMFEYQMKTSDGAPLDVSISVIVTFASNKLVKLTVWKIEST